MILEEFKCDRLDWIVVTIAKTGEELSGWLIDWDYAGEDEMDAIEFRLEEGDLVEIYVADIESFREKSPARSKEESEAVRKAAHKLQDRFHAAYCEYHARFGYWYECSCASFKDKERLCEALEKAVATGVEIGMEACPEEQRDDSCHFPYFETEDGSFILDGWDTGYDPTDPLKGLSEEERARAIELLGDIPVAHWVECADGTRKLEW